MSNIFQYDNNTPYQRIIHHITPKSTPVWGLKFFPSLEPHFNNDRDDPPCGYNNAPLEVSDGNLSIVNQAMQYIKNHCKSIVEIGVCRNADRSMTHIFLNNKLPQTIYLGIDLEDKSFLNNPLKNIHTLKSNSHEQVIIRQHLYDLGVEKIDLLMIDGWHSVNSCVNDWAYTDLLSDHGLVILHDTNAHPGCVALFHAVDENLFYKERYCTNFTDNGIATFLNKKGNIL